MSPDSVFEGVTVGSAARSRPVAHSGSTALYLINVSRRKLLISGATVSEAVADFVARRDREKWPEISVGATVPLLMDHGHGKPLQEVGMVCFSGEIIMYPPVRFR